MKKKKTLPEYYAYYEKKTGRICSITNEKSLVYKDYIPLTVAEYKKFCDGDWEVDQYTVDKTLGLVAIESQTYNFKNSMFEWIVDKPSADTHFVVTWNEPKQLWEFRVSDDTRDKLLESNSIAKLSFFVTLESDLNFLVRTISFNVADIVQCKTIEVPFESKLETDIKNISIASVKAFKTYGLEVIHE